MPEVIERRGIRARPETKPRPEIEIIKGLDFENEGVRLDIKWDINPLRAHDVHVIFSGLETLLNQTTRAFLSTDETGREVLEMLEDSEPLLDIEVEELTLSSLKTVLRLRSKKIYTKIKESPKVVKEHLKGMAIDKALEEAMKGGAHLAVMLMMHFGLMHGHAKTPEDISGATGLPQYVVEQELKHGREFLRNLEASNVPSTLFIGETVKGTRATVTLPLPPNMP